MTEASKFFSLVECDLQQHVDVARGAQRALVVKRASITALLGHDLSASFGPGCWLYLPAGTGIALLLAEITHVLHFDDRSVLSLGMVGMPPLVEMTLPRPAASLKNSRSVHTEPTMGYRPAPDGKSVILEPGMRAISRKSKAQRLDVEMVRNYANTAVGRMRGRARGPNGQPFADDDAIELRCRHVIATDELHVIALRVGTLPPGDKGVKRGTKRDVHGTVELIADALQGLWYGDDRQIDMASQGRVR